MISHTKSYEERKVGKINLLIEISSGYYNAYVPHMHLHFIPSIYYVVLYSYSKRVRIKVNLQHSTLVLVSVKFHDNIAKPDEN